MYFFCDEQLLGIIKFDLSSVQFRDYAIAKQTKIKFPAVGFQCGPSNHNLYRNPFSILGYIYNMRMDGRTDAPPLYDFSCLLCEESI
jgi:hypothetical protein